MIPQSDIEFIRTRLLPWSGVEGVRLAWSKSTAKWPDIWVSKSMDGIPKITVTAEWKRQNMNERRKRLVHEFLHLIGLIHPEGGSVKIGKLVYSTHPHLDTYSETVYRRFR